MADAYGLEVTGVSLSIGREDILRGISVRVPAGDCLALLGPSGSGKTSLLRIIAGLQKPDAGRVFIDGRDVTNSAPGDRQISMLFQEPALFPGKTIIENALAARLAKGAPKHQVEAAITDASEMIDLFQLTRQKDKPVDVLSGGQYQRAALVRCLVNATDSTLLLLDEPFQSNLNLSLRWELMRCLKEWLSKGSRKLTSLLVTHEFAEAAYFANRIAIIDEATRAAETDSVEGLYDRAANPTIARTVGPINCWKVRSGAMPLSVLEPDPSWTVAAEQCICRPSRVQILRDRSGFKVINKTFLGSISRIVLSSQSVTDFEITADVPLDDAPEVGQTCGIEISQKYVAFYDANQKLIPRTT
jgi:ABC-type Fe3+/spermidine/putrescine transport system ATPase subunit